MFNLDGDVVGQLRKFAMQRLNNRQRMRGTIEKVRIAEGNVLRPSLNLLANIFQYHVAIDNPKCAVVNRHNRAVTAVMLAAAAGFRITNRARLPGGHDEPRIFLEWDHSSAIGE